MSDDFHLHERLAADTVSLGQTDLCEIRLMNDRTWPWVLLVPRRPGIREIYQLSVADQQQLLAESSALGQGMMEAFEGHKLNVAALGNMVPQLHLHHIVRREGDTGWPGPSHAFRAQHVSSPPKNQYGSGKSGASSSMTLSRTR